MAEVAGKTILLHRRGLRYAVAEIRSGCIDDGSHCGNIQLCDISVFGFRCVSNHKCGKQETFPVGRFAGGNFPEKVLLQLFAV